MKKAIEWFAGSLCVYGIVAACAGADRSVTPGENAGSGGTGAGGTNGSVTVNGSGGTEGAVATATSSGPEDAGTGDVIADVVEDVMDAMTDPVPDASADPAESGDRLKARYRVGADGSREFAGWYDSARSENCSFQSANGTMRCLPSYGATGGAYFSDANCSQPLFVGIGCTSGYGMLTTAAANGCDSTSEFHQLVTVSPAVVYIGSGDTCIESAANESLVYYRSNGVLSFDLFVSGTEEVDP